jgi:lipoprotein-anchoring transpeptidase ErfK/SrfK
MYIYKDGYVIASTDINIGQAEKSGSSGTQIGGKQGDKTTPIGEFTLTNDQRHSENGVYTNDGKTSLGTSFLGLSAKDENGNYRGIGIHGSKDDSLRPTNGCIRVKNADSNLLFSSLKVGTKVKIQA